MIPQANEIDLFSTRRSEAIFQHFGPIRKMTQLGAVKMNSTIIRIVTTKAAIEDKTL